MVKWEYQVGPLTVNFRVLLEPKGFLRIIILFVALFAFAITAGFNSSSTANRLMCQGSNGTNSTNFTTNIIFNYPYASGNFRFNPPPDTNTQACREAAAFSTRALSSSAQFFVAMGVLTMLYVIGAVLVYMMFITPELFLAKWLVIGDFFVTLGFGVLYVIACIAWSAGAADLNSYARSSLSNYGRRCLNCSETSNLQIQFFAAPTISLIFGWLAAFIWLSSSWFVYKDTVWHKDMTGPLAKLYEVTKKAGSSGGGGGGGEEGGDAK